MFCGRDTAASILVDAFQILVQLHITRYMLIAKGERYPCRGSGGSID